MVTAASANSKEWTQKLCYSFDLANKNYKKRGSSYGESSELILYQYDRCCDKGLTVTHFKSSMVSKMQP